MFCLTAPGYGESQVLESLHPEASPPKTPPHSTSFPAGLGAQAGPASLMFQGLQICSGLPLLSQSIRTQERKLSLEKSGGAASPKLSFLKRN